MRLFSLSSLVYFLCLFVSSCNPSASEQSSTTANQDASIEYASFKLEPGDILFQDSDCGPFCESIEKVTNGVSGAKFSHVGLLTTNAANEYVILEAITAGVVETPLDSFFTRSYDENGNSKVVVGRLKQEHKSLIPTALKFAEGQLGRAYDDVFDITNDKYYCSELIYDAFKHANNDEPIFQLQPMTFNDPDTKAIFPIWETYFHELNVAVPEGEAGLNPGGMSMSPYLDIVHFYGRPQGYIGEMPQ